MSRRPFRDRPLPILETNAGGSLKTAALAFDKRERPKQMFQAFLSVILFYLCQFPEAWET